MSEGEKRSIKEYSFVAISFIVSGNNTDYGTSSLLRGAVDGAN